VLETTLPPLVERAYAVARQHGLIPAHKTAGGPTRPSACLPGVGQFLAMLAAGCHGGVIAELGTGAGIGAAWIASAMPADCTLVSAELDAGLAAASAQLLADDARVHVQCGDAIVVLATHAPFDLVFADCGDLDRGRAARPGELPASRHTPLNRRPSRGGPM